MQKTGDNTGFEPGGDELGGDGSGTETGGEFVSFQSGRQQCLQDTGIWKDRQS